MESESLAKMGKRPRSGAKSLNNSEDADSEHGGSAAKSADVNHARWLVAVHGGAAQGYLSDVLQKKYRDCMKEACRRAADALERGCSAEDAVMDNPIHKPFVEVCTTKCFQYASSAYLIMSICGVIANKMHAVVLRWPSQGSRERCI